MKKIKRCEMILLGFVYTRTRTPSMLLGTFHARLSIKYQIPTEHDTRKDTCSASQGKVDQVYPFQWKINRPKLRHTKFSVPPAKQDFQTITMFSINGKLFDTHKNPGINGNNFPTTSPEVSTE